MDFNIETFIEEIRKYPCIYARNSLDYRNKVKRGKCWEIIGSKFNMEEELCMTKWRNIRDKYTREVNKNSQHTRWRYFKQLSFLREFVLPKRTYINDVPIIDDSTPKPTFCFPGYSPSDFPTKTPAIFPDLEDIQSINLDENPPTFEKFEHKDAVVEEKPMILTSNTSESSNNCTTCVPKGVMVDECFCEFLHKMIQAHEKRNVGKEPSKHDAFYRLVDVKLSELPDSEQEDSKMFFLNFLHSKIKQQN